MKTIHCVLIMVHSCLWTFAQMPGAAPLFQDEKPLEIKFAISLDDLKRTTQDSVYFPTVMTFKNDDGSWDSVHIDIRARGNFRRKYCSIPPMRIKINKADRKGKLFEGTKSLKLVLPCHVTKNNNDLVLKEYVCYQLYEPTTPYVFGTRLVEITLNETSGRNSKTYQLKGFFIEDDDAVAKRFDSKVVDVDKLHPLSLQDTCSIRMDLFQYMIGNTDFSTTFFHNAKIIKTKRGKYIPIAYDFDMSGFVNAPYATWDPSLEISTVRERVYRGFCRDEQVAEYVRAEYINLEPAILGVIDRHQAYFDPRELAGMRRYVHDFFSTMKNDGSYRQRIAATCRTR